MEDDRKGTWEDVTEDCGTRLASDDSCLYVCYPGKGYVRALLGKHGIYGHCVEGGVAGDSPNAKGYRLARPTADTWAIEHFIPGPEPEWTDITRDCVLSWVGPPGRVCIRIADEADKAIGYVGDTPEVNNTRRYRITVLPHESDAADCGYIRIEKRNG